MSIICPQCRKDDMIQKVSAVYSAGFASGSYSGPSTGVAIGSSKPALVSGYTTVLGISQTALSSRLSPPAKPVMPYGYGTTGLFTIVASYGIVLLIAIFLQLGAPQGETSGIVCFAIFAPFLFVYLVSWAVQKRKVEASLPQWTAAIQKWNELYYCARDDGVFTPHGSQFIPASQLNDYLYQ